MEMRRSLISLIILFKKHFNMRYKIVEYNQHLYPLKESHIGYHRPFTYTTSTGAIIIFCYTCGASNMLDFDGYLDDDAERYNLNMGDANEDSICSCITHAIIFAKSEKEILKNKLKYF